jgi:hypothetical protein
MSTPDVSNLLTIIKIATADIIEFMSAKTTLEVLMPVLVKIIVVSLVTPCSQVDIYSDVSY